MTDTLTDVVRRNKKFRDVIASLNLADIMDRMELNLADAELLKQQAIVAQLKD